MKTYVHMYVAEFLECETLQTSLLWKSKHIFYVHQLFFWKSCCLWDYVEKYCRTWQATDDNIIQGMHFSCWITAATDTTYIAFPLQQWLCKFTSVLHYTYIACLVIVTDTNARR